MDKQYDAAIIGSGPGGYVAAIRCSQLGLKTALVEKNRTFGGTCLNVGCIPSKALLDSSEFLINLKNKSAVHGITFAMDSIYVDLKRMMKRKEDIVSKMTGGIKSLLSSYKIDTFEGTGKLKNNHTITVENSYGTENDIAAANIILATGSVPIELPQLPFDHEKIIDSTDALSLEKAPGKFAIIGAGAIGLEIGSIWSRLGSEVVIIEMMDQILPQSDSKTCARLAQVLTKQGLSFRLSTTVISADIDKNNIKLTLKDNNAVQSEIMCDKVLIAAGRKPQPIGGAEKTGIKVDSKTGKIFIDGYFRTSVPDIYAIGDIVPGPMLAHKASEEGIAVPQIIAKGTAEIDYNTMPSVVYTWPEYAAVGPGETMLIKNGIPYKSGIFQFRANGRALAGDNSEGFVKLFAEEESGRLLGAQIVGPHASELVGEIITVMKFNGKAEDIARTVHPHPALSEVVKEAAMDADKWSIHSLSKVALP